MTLPEDAEVRAEPGRVVVIYTPRLRRQLFHWGRGHEFHSGAARDALLRDDQLYEDGASVRDLLERGHGD
jgi:hypothetical protein